ncbi:MAG TPA: tRNA (adenosine(37)-N6)-threonylcarbamoyltransferase complex dimerization subunit type 1 TsaB [Bacilli bacterium]|jgi:tRNA threonylcarbamoyladenosine biosynthesis protein TsaB|nr:tRNA (adenosine(37)-N6)-threonylcarbamoyltransferase complex dimerization subunit type 1 TsaB [Bacilli bacterium]HQC83464.1 tRNA (adenosine(37)-N6)-threonylcarbamoyltransferase complex dimerization subunit type 1 TsaB [Bacilli bacterium]
MNTLFIDTHDSHIILAIFKDGTILSSSEKTSERSHSNDTMPMLKKLLNDVNLSVHDLNDIIVVNGPGSFTGVRIGVTIAKTLAYTLNIPIRTITSLEMYAVSNNTNSNKLVLMHDLKGAYGAVFTKDNKLVDNYFYLSNADLKSYLEANNIEVVNNIINLEKVFDFSRTKETTISHKVNPIYIKLIGVEENDKRI